MTTKHLHEKLGITFQELAALFAVRALLDRQLISFTPDSDIEPEAGEHMFNMNIGCVTHHCGSIGCIGGYMGMVMGVDGSHYVASKQDDGLLGPRAPLRALFYPPNDLRWDTIEPHHAVKAIDNFIKAGDPMWWSIEGIEEKED